MADDRHRQMRGKVFPIRGHARRHHPGPCGRLCGGIAKGEAPDSGVGGGGGGVGADFAARLPLPSCRVEYASITASQTPGVTDQDLRWSEAWLSNRWRLAGMIKAVIAGPPLQAHHRGRARGEHLARPRRGAGGRVVQRPLEELVVCAVVVGGGCGCGGLAKDDNFASHVTFAGGN
jgi:hypothetical protein